MINLRCSVALIAVAALAGCSSGGGGGGGGGGGPITSAEFQENFDRVSALGPTSDMPTSLQASYAGAMQFDVTEGADIDGSVTADLNIDVDWTDGQTSNPFSGGASNFVGEFDGVSENIAGEMTVDDSFGGTISRVSTDIPLPTGGVQTVDTGAMQFVLTGELESEGDVVTGELLLGGNFFGPEGEAAIGAVAGGFRGEEASGQIFDLGAAGFFYLEQQ